MISCWETKENKIKAVVVLNYASASLFISDRGGSLILITNNFYRIIVRLI